MMSRERLSMCGAIERKAGVVVKFKMFAFSASSLLDMNITVRHVYHSPFSSCPLNMSLVLLTHFSCLLRFFRPIGTHCFFIAWYL